MLTFTPLMDKLYNGKMYRHVLQPAFLQYLAEYEHTLRDYEFDTIAETASSCFREFNARFAAEEKRSPTKSVVSDVQLADLANTDPFMAMSIMLARIYDLLPYGHSRPSHYSADLIITKMAQCVAYTIIHQPELNATFLSYIQVTEYVGMNMPVEGQSVTRTFRQMHKLFPEYHAAYQGGMHSTFFIHPQHAHLITSGCQLAYVSLRHCALSVTGPGECDAQLRDLIACYIKIQSTTPKCVNFIDTCTGAEQQQVIDLIQLEARLDKEIVKHVALPPHTFVSEFTNNPLGKKPSDRMIATCLQILYMNWFIYETSHIMFALLWHLIGFTNCPEYYEQFNLIKKEDD